MLDLAPIALMTTAMLVWLLNQKPPMFSPVLEDGMAIDEPTEPDDKPWEKLLMFKKGGGSAPAPDPQIGEAALRNAELGEDWLDFAEAQFDASNERQEGLDSLTETITQDQLEQSETAQQWAKEDRGSAMSDRRWALGQRDKLMKWAGEDREFATDLRSDYDKFKPVNERLVDDAMNWDSDARLDERSARARSDVQRNASMAQQQNQRNMASMGVDPRSGRAQSVNRQQNLQTALASTGAQNQARDQARQQAQGMRQNASSLGQNVLSQSQNATQVANSTNQAGMGAAGFAASQYNAQLGAAGLGVNAGNSAMGNAMTNQQQFNSNASIMGQGFQGAMSGNSSSANILNQQYGNQLNAWSAQQQAEAQGTAGLMQGLGTLGGAAIMASSKDYKTDKRKVSGASEAIQGMPVEKWKYKDGIADGGEHIGPYAEDFKRETGQGDGKSIPLQDAVGLTMKAVQEQGIKLDRMEQRMKKKGATA